jgi:membrane-bound lytic murein transglycosylase D
MGNQTTAALNLVPADKRASWRMHRVEADETFAAVAKRYGVSAVNLLAANKLSEPKVEIGDRLLIPAASRPEPVTRRIAARSTAGKTSAHTATSRKGKTAGKTAAGPASKPAKAAAIVASASRR